MIRQAGLRGPGQNVRLAGTIAQSFLPIRFSCPFSLKARFDAHSLNYRVRGQQTPQSNQLHSTEGGGADASSPYGRESMKWKPLDFLFAAPHLRGTGVADSSCDRRSEFRYALPPARRTIRFRSRRDRRGLFLREVPDDLSLTCGSDRSSPPRVPRERRDLLLSSVARAAGECGRAKRSQLVSHARRLIAGEEDHPEVQTMPALEASSTPAVIPGTGGHAPPACQ
jgi:hypothetical protein